MAESISLLQLGFAQMSLRMHQLPSTALSSRARKCTHTHTHPHYSIDVYCTLSASNNKAIDQCFVKSSPQGLTVQLVSNANQKWRDRVLLTRFCSCFTQLLHCIRGAQDAHCLQATVAQLWEPVLSPHMVRQQTPLSTTTTPTAGKGSDQSHWRDGRHICMLWKPSRDSISKC